MDADLILTGLLVIALVLAVLLMGISLLILGRKLADLEYQAEAGVNGVRRRQSWVNIRTYACRVFLGSVFVIVNVLLLADAPLEWRMWANRVLWVLLLGAYVRAGIMDWIADGANLREMQSRLRGSRTQALAEATSSDGQPVDGLTIAGTVTGPAGPAGIQGPIGPQGQVGPAGIQGEHVP